MRVAAPVVMLGLLAGAAPVQAAAPGLTVHPPSVSPGLAEPRIAVLIVPVRPDGGPRSVVAHSDEEAYRKRLQEIGFEVWTVGPADRPGLDRSLRDVVSRLPSGAHVAVLALGAALSGTSDVHIVPADASPDLATSPALVETETIRLGDVLRRLAARSPRSLVAVVDECQRPAGGTCMLEDSASQASVMAGVRGTAQANGGLPLTSRASLREVLLEGMVQEGHTFVQTFGFVRERLSGSDLSLVAGPSLTTAFAFLPQGFFARLRSECNQVDLNADPTALRGASLDGVVRACEAALATHPYARHFQERLAAAREQRAFQRAITSCEDRLAASAYGSTYPTGRFRRIVDDFVTDCTRRREEQRQSEERRERERMEAERRERERQAQLENERRERQIESERRERERQAQQDNERRERQREEERQRTARDTARSRSGWALSYSTGLLHIEPQADDNYEPQKQTFSTIWHSNEHDDVTLYVQVSVNTQCRRDAQQYVQEQLVPRRARLTRSQAFTGNPGRTSHIIEGTGTGRTPNVQYNLAFLDFVSINRSDPSTIVHIGGRFPIEHTDTYRAELLRMMNSLDLPARDYFTNQCP